MDLKELNERTTPNAIEGATLAELKHLWNMARGLRDKAAAAQSAECSLIEHAIGVIDSGIAGKKAAEATASTMEEVERRHRENITESKRQFEANHRGARTARRVAVCSASVAFVSMLVGVWSAQNAQHTRAQEQSVLARVDSLEVSQKEYRQKIQALTAQLLADQLGHSSQIPPFASKPLLQPPPPSKALPASTESHTGTEAPKPMLGPPKPNP